MIGQLGNNVSQTRTVRFSLTAGGTLPGSAVLLDLSPYHRWVLLTALLFDNTNPVVPPQLIVPPAGPFAGMPFGMWAFDQNRLTGGNAVDNAFILAPNLGCLIQVPANQRIYGTAVGAIGNPAGATQVGISITAQNFLEPTTDKQTVQLVEGFREVLQQVMPRAVGDALRVVVGAVRGR